MLNRTKQKTAATLGKSLNLDSLQSTLHYIIINGTSDKVQKFS